MNDAHLSVSAAELRAAFDESFSRETDRDGEAPQELLLIRVNETEMALRVRDTARIMRCPPLTVMPSRNRALAGLAGVRGALVAVYGLSSLVGDARPSRIGGWIVLCAADKSVALQFDELVAYVRVSAADIHRAEARDSGAGAEAARIGDVHVNLIRVPELIDDIRRAARSDADKER
jgi:chemotaxis signal transduction protein